jgi:hypothetical protein
MFAGQKHTYRIMSHQFETIRKPRTTVLSIIDNLSVVQMNTIPAGFRNNIIWNLGHLVAAQQGICYKRAGLPITVDEDFFETYRAGSKPERIYTAEDIAQIKELLVSTINQLEADLQTDQFTNYPAITTRYGVELNNINEAISFLPFHEGIHIGTIVALKKLVEPEVVG